MAITSIGEAAFRYCENLDVVVDLPNLTSLGNFAFNGCKALKRIENLGQLTTILGSNNFGGTFGGCDALEFVRIPATVTTISYFAFSNCYSLKAIVCDALTPPSLSSTNAFNNTNSCPIYVPDASVDAYKAATNWSTYASRIKPLSEYAE